MKPINKYLYWLIQLTWGIITTAIGFLVTFVLRCFGYGMICNGYGYITPVGGNWGGLSIGPFAFCGRYNDKEGPCYNPSWYHSTRKHEFGHSIQVLILGPFWLFVVGIPSAIRYWYYTLSIKFGKSFPSNWYDQIWFEKTATEKGSSWIDQIEGGLQ